MNHYKLGGLSDGDGSEDGKNGEEGGGDTGSGAGDSFPAAGIMGALPLSPFLHGFLGALPHGDGIHGGGKNVALVAANS